VTLLWHISGMATIPATSYHEPKSGVFFVGPQWQYGTILCQSVATTVCHWIFPDKNCNARLFQLRRTSHGAAVSFLWLQSRDTSVEIHACLLTY